MMRDLNGKTAWITGAGTGFGRAAALSLAEEGMSVVLSGRRSEKLEEVAALIRMALEHIPPERLIATTDCGFGREGLSRRIAFYKMVALVEGTNIVRKELGLPEAEVRASDPRFAFSYEG